MGLITLESPAINYNISCMDAHGSTVLNACLNDTKETKFVTLYDLLPFTEYTCRLVKVVSPATPNATVINPVNLHFKTAEAGQCICMFEQAVYMVKFCNILFPYVRIDAIL